MVTDEVIGASWLPTDGYLDPSHAHLRARRRRTGGWRGRSSPTPASPAIHVERRRRDGRAAPTAATSSARSSSTPAACSRPRSAGWPACASRSSRWRTSTSSPSRSANGTAHIATMRDPDHLIYFREEGGGLVWGGYERASAPWSLHDDGRGLDAIPADFNGRLLEEDWDRFEEIVAFAQMRVPALDRRPGHPADQRPGGVHARRRVLPRRDRGRAACSSPPASARTAWPAPAGVGKVMAEWIAGGEPELDLWAMDVRRFGAHYRSPSYTVKRAREVYETYYDIKYPNHERSAGRPLRVSPVYDWHREHGAVFGEKSGWERVNWYAANEAAGDESLRPRGWAGMHWSPAIGAEHRGLPRGRGAVRRDLVRQDRGAAGRAPPSCSSTCATTAWRARSAASPTRRCSTRAAGSSATSRSRGWPRTASGSSPAPRSAATTWPGSRQHAGAGVRVEDVTSRWACVGPVGPAGARRAGRRDHRRPRLRLHAAGASSRSATCRCAPCGSPTSASCGWELYCPMEFGSALWRTLWEAGAAARAGRGRLPGDRLAAAGEGLPRVGRRHHARRHALRGRPRLLRAGRQGLPRQGRARRASPRAGCAASRSPIRARSRSPTSRCASAARSPAASPAAATATRWSARSPTRYLPAEHAAPGTEVAVEIFGEWVEGEVADRAAVGS